MIHVITGAWDDVEWYGDVTIDGKLLDPEKSLRVRNHSPDGFSWGYAGSGPAQLALAILLEVTTKEKASKFYQRFKHKFIANLPRAAFDIEVDIDEWLAKQEALEAIKEACRETADARTINGA